MSREIKFRAWDKATLKMSPDFVLFGEFTMLGAVHDWQHEMGNKSKSSLHALNDLEIMQFTGLKDKNGKEIFEGDLLKHTGEPRWFPWLIEFHKGSFCIINVGVDGYRHEPMYLTEDRALSREVIGNIYEKSDLLTEKA